MVFNPAKFEAIQFFCKQYFPNPQIIMLAILIILLDELQIIKFFTKKILYTN